MILQESDPDPLAGALQIAGLVCFFNERVDLELDGVVQERPESPWKHGVKAKHRNPRHQTRG